MARNSPSQPPKFSSFSTTGISQQKGSKWKPVVNGKMLCSRCGEHKLVEDFPKKGQKRKDGSDKRYAYCKPCHSVRQREQNLFVLFRLTSSDYDKILAYQNGVCAICKQPPKNRRLAVDHDHKTGLIRGLICAFCNRAIGLFRDDIKRFIQVIKFMKHPPATEALGEDRFGIKGRVSNKRGTMRKMNRDLFERPKAKS